MSPNLSVTGSRRMSGAGAAGAGHTHPCARRGRSAASPPGGCSLVASGLSLPLEAAKVFFPTTLFLKTQFFHSSERHKTLLHI